MSGNINTVNNIDNNNGVITSIGAESNNSNASDDSVQSAKDNINNITGSISRNSASAQSSSSTVTGSGFISSSSRRTGNRTRSQATPAKREGAAEQKYISSFNARDTTNRRNREVPQSSFIQNTRPSSRTKKNQADTRRLTAQSHFFQKTDNNKYAYSKYLGGAGQEINRDTALDALLFSDIANTMIDNGFSLDSHQRESIRNFEHEFSDSFADYENVFSDILYQQAALVDALVSNGAFLTPEQEIELGIPDGLSSDS